MRLEFHPEAELELIEAAVHYELQVPGLGRRLEAEIRRATDLLLQHPGIGPHVDPDLRKFVLGRFPFMLIYSVARDVLRIEVVAHQSRLPGYWKSRIDR
ncbi:MAG: type II toxin-antitoxin system RelE/ParE family toxin [Betaproteobacteria bacterium]|nr:type II toxin-antitoxin system RelE/ParE family toxin [Betaproteobacteria bacterium]